MSSSDYTTHYRTRHFKVGELHSLFGQIVDNWVAAQWLRRIARMKLNSYKTRPSRSCRRHGHASILSRSRSTRRAGRHVSRSFFAVAADSGGGDGGDGQSDSDCNRLAFAVCGKGEFGVAAVRDGQGQFGRINGIIVSRYRALPAQTRGAQGDGRFFVPFWRWAA